MTRQFHCRKNILSGMSSVAVLSVYKPINQTVEALCTSPCGGYSGDIGTGATAMGLHHMIANRTYNI